jgi:hypothetical protein
MLWWLIRPLGLCLLWCHWYAFSTYGGTSISVPVTITASVVSSFMYISDPPTINVSPPSPYQIREGERAVMSCLVTDANPNTGITWSWTKSGSSTVLHRGQNYSIPNIHRGQRGDYQCTATNSIGLSAPATVQVDVHCK